MKRWHFYLGLALLLAVAAAVLLPMYGDYAVRARVADGIASTYAYRQTVAEAILAHGKLPLPPAALPKADAAAFSKTVQSVQATPNGELRITFQGNRSIEGRSIVQVPTLGQRGMVESWTCYNIDMPERELSPTCRAKRP